ncbi:MAG: hypothetical protein C4584_00070 [Armatimonadetes bacterium]|nr:MAG: hypothetical protein C4584_00070 [Armatimonadota bacterium]
MIKPSRLRLAASPGQISLSTRDKWDGAEGDLFKLLKAAHVLRSSHQLRIKLSEFLVESPQFNSVTEALLFFEFARDRITHLLDASIEKRLDCLRLASYSYIESSILRRAIFEGVYLTKQFRTQTYTPVVTLN